MVPDDWTGEVEEFPKKVTIAADKNEAMLSPNGDSSGDRCPNEANGLDRSTKDDIKGCLLYTSPSPRDRTRSRMPSSA